MDNDKEKEDVLLNFLALLDEHVFILETDSVSGETKQKNPRVEDLEGIILINGEWDREDLKNILAALKEK